MRGWGRDRVVPALAVVTIVHTWVSIGISLQQAPGVLPSRGAPIPDAQFLHPGWFAVSALGFVLGVLTAALSPRWGLVAVLGSAAAQVVGYAIADHRTDEAGLGTGLDVLGYAFSLTWALLGLAAVVLSALTRRVYRHEKARLDALRVERVASP